MSETIEKSVVQVIAESYDINYSYPWNFMGKFSSTGSGFCIEWRDHKYVLTNAHCVHNTNDIRLRKRGTSELFPARILWIVYECDLALLDLAEPLDDSSNFWDDMVPLRMGRMPNKLEKVYVYGYPLGGFNVSVTKGVISRIQVVRYFGSLNGIAIQVDAAINFGNSGGPAVNKVGDVVGVAFAGEDDSMTQNMGYIIPPVIIEYFLRSFTNANADGVFGGLCSIEVSTQSLHNLVLRKYINIPTDKTGVLITGIDRANVSHKHLQIDDVLMTLDGRSIYNDGTISLADVLSIYDAAQSAPRTVLGPLGSGEIIPYHNYIHLKSPGDILELGIWRSGKEIVVKFPVEPHHFTIPKFEYQSTLSYYIVMGLVFLPVSLPLIREKKQNNEYIHHLIELAKFPISSKKSSQVIVLSDIFTSEFTEEFPLGNYILQSVNGVDIRDMSHLVDTVTERVKKDEYVRFEFKDRTGIVLLKSSDVRKHDRHILEENVGGIPNYRI